MNIINIKSIIKRWSYWVLFLLLSNSYAQTIMFDDFNYNSVSDQNLNFNKWSIVDGLNGPPSGAMYQKNNITFVNDTSLVNNKIITLSTTVSFTNGVKKLTHSRIETSGYDYFEGTYAARVYFDDLPNIYGDANIQTFYTIVSYLLGEDGSKYSEIDFEYMPSDKWYGGQRLNDPVMYLTAWNRYIADPWQAWKNTISNDNSWKGWHTLVVQANDGTNVKFWIDGNYYGSVSVTDNDGTSVYPRSKMQVAFANWIWNSEIGTSKAYRKSTIAADWVLYTKDISYSPSQVDSIINDFRIRKILRKNLSGVEFKESVTELEGDLSNTEASIAYPNPVTNVLHLNNVEKWILLNNQGQTISSGESSEIQFQDYNSGIYYLNVNNQFVKIIKQ